MKKLDCTTEGEVIRVKKLWWIKINTKPIRTHALDGAVFPHTITVKYTVGASEYIKKKFVKARFIPPQVGDTVRVSYNADDPSKCRIEFDEKELSL